MHGHTHARACPTLPSISYHSSPVPFKLQCSFTSPKCSKQPMLKTTQKKRLKRVSCPSFPYIPNRQEDYYHKTWRVGIQDPSPENLWSWFYNEAKPVEGKRGGRRQGPKAGKGKRRRRKRDELKQGSVSRTRRRLLSQAPHAYYLGS